MSFLKHTLENESYAAPHSLTLASGVKLEFLQTGILRVRPAAKSEFRIIISCGIHGNETAPIEIVEQLFQEIKLGQLKVTNELLFIIGNPPAANRAERFIEENLNRLFSGKHQGSTTQEAKRAKLIEHYVEQFLNEGNEPRLHYDLHTAIRGSEFEKFAIYPYLHDRSFSKPQMAFLESCGIEAVLLSHQPSGTFSYFTSTSLGADAFTVELGKVEKFGDNNMAKFSAVLKGLRRLVSGEEAFINQPNKIQFFSVIEEIVKQSNDFKLHVAEDAKNFTAFPKGSVLASDNDYQYTTQQDGERFVFPLTNVPIGQRAMLVVAPAKL